MKHPGFDWIISPTRDWQIPAPDAWSWAAYSSTGQRVGGFAPTAEEAEQAAREAVKGIKEREGRG